MTNQKSILKSCKCCSGGAYFTWQYKSFFEGDKRTFIPVWVCNNCRFEKHYKGFKKEFDLYTQQENN